MCERIKTDLLRGLTLRCAHLKGITELSVEQQPRCRFKQWARLSASFRQRTVEVERVTNGGGRFVVRHGTARH